ncbi:MAG: HAD hydrolase-like protein [Butyrivibrio sp.]|nr:HAD hydrolase-like protein [Butyrivibrio sp.]
MNKYKYILFDLDGTITESGPGIMNAAKYALKHYGIEENDISKLKLFVGPPLDVSFMDRYGFDKEKASEAIAKFREYYNVTGIFENSVYEGMKQLLESLRSSGYKIAIASSKPQVMVHRVLEHFDIQNYFDVIVGCELDGRRSKKEEVIEEVLDQFGFKKGDDLSDMVMIGDRCYDMTGAVEFGMTGIGVLYGYGTRKELEESGATIIAATVDDLKNILLNQGI